MTHVTDLRDTEAIVNAALDDLEQVLIELRRPLDASRAHNESCRNALRALVAATRANHPLEQAVRHLEREFGSTARVVLVLALLRRVQLDALTPETRRHPLPAGVHTPVPGTGEPLGDDDVTPPLGRPAAAAAIDPVDAIEVDVTPGGAPTRPLKPNYTAGPWPMPPAKPRGRR